MAAIIVDSSINSTEPAVAVGLFGVAADSAPDHESTLKLVP